MINSMRSVRLLPVWGVQQLVQGHARVSTSSVSLTTTTSSIPGPKCYPVVGTLPDILTDKEFDKEKIHLYFMKLFKKYGPIVKIKAPGEPTTVLVLRPEDCREILQHTRENPVRTPMGCLKKARDSNPFYEKKAGIVTENGEEWWRVRSKVQVPVLKPEYVHSYLHDMDLVTQDLLERISRLRDANGEITVNFKEELEKWSLENICLISLNQRVGCFDPNMVPGSEPDLIVTAARNFMSALKDCESGSKLWKIYPTKTFKQLQQSMDEVTKTCEGVLQEIEANLERVQSEEEMSRHKPKMVELLLREPGLTRKDVITFMVDLIPGATETTSDNAAVVLYQLARNPQVQVKVQGELDRVLGDGTSPITPHHLAQLTYTKAVFKESNRIMPPLLGPVRILQDNMCLGEYTLEKGWVAFLMSALTAWDEEEFSRPLEFVPERWLRHRPLGSIHPCASLPFSHGIRMCPGKRIAEQEIYTLIARTLHRYNLDWKYGDLERTHKFVFSFKDPLKFTFIDR
ncbi:hypothetical protein Pcinc_033294 [Petrolisthes cinctipes]|uniref:Cytochrome P450 n=1 Tax=Petrolisthes cinctipes TaxID=88211 RepID=A0AAE1ESE9_PETCI|nr:hypothetical protein Pcinc_033294 [Petrolisthes cinctipes]